MWDGMVSLMWDIEETATMSKMPALFNYSGDLHVYSDDLQWEMSL